MPVAVEETFSGSYIVVFDPLDGCAPPPPTTTSPASARSPHPPFLRSSNIDAAVSTGSIFGIYEPTTTCIAPGSADEATVQARAHSLFRAPARAHARCCCCRRPCPSR